MSKNIYDEAIAEAKLLKDAAEQNAKNAIIEAVTPRIRSFIEEQLLGEGDESADESDVLGDVASEVVGGLESPEVALDESALSSLVELVGGSTSQNFKSSPVFKSAIQESFSGLSNNEKHHLLNVANKLNQNVDLLSGNDINNDVHVQQESSSMARSDDILYEVNLEELAGVFSEDLDEQAWIDAVMSEEDTDDDGDASGEPQDEDWQLEEVLRSLGLSNILNEDKIEIDLGDHELPDDVQISAVRVSEEEEEIDFEDVESAEGEEGEEDEEEFEEEEVELPEELQEVFEIDPAVLRSELHRLRRKISEAKDLANIKGIKDAKEGSWGGSGSSKVGVKGAYGGTGGGKTGVDGSYGGGKGMGDPLKVKLNKLSEAVVKERRKNRALQGRLNEYRSAVETLREQLTDLNLFNAKLLYVNKLLQNKDITSSQKRSVVESIDKARTLREVKLIFKTLTESFSKGDRGALRESHVRRTIGSSSRMTSRASAEIASAEVSRWATLAGIKEN